MQISVSSQPSFQMRPALIELDKTLYPLLDFDSSAGMKQLLAEEGLVALRVATQAQVAHVMLVMAAIRHNQV